MMKRLGLLFVCSLLTTVAMAGKIGEWKSYFAYGVSTQMEKQGDEVFAFAGDAIFSVNTQSGEIGRYDKQAGLSGRTINRIAYNESTQTLLIGYADGLLDFRDKNGDFYALPDLQTKDLSVNKQINHVLMVGDLAYCAMNFGVMVVNMRKREIADTYHLASDTAYLCATAIVGDSIFAISSSKMYVAALKDNLLDFGMWHVSTPITKTGNLMALAAQNDQLYLIKDSVLYVRKGVQWQVMNDQTSFLNIRNHGGSLYFVSKEGIFSLQNDQLSLIHYTQGAVDILPASEGYWMIEGSRSIIFLERNGDKNYYYPDGPATDKAFRMKFAYGKLYVVPGGRWATENHTSGDVMVYDGQYWHNIWNTQITSQIGDKANDFMNVAVDPFDHEHFFVTSYGEGLFEFRNYQFVKQYTYNNSPLKSAAPSSPYYVRTDAALFDDEGNMFLINTSDYASTIHILSHEQLLKAPSANYAIWDTLNLYTRESERVVIYTPQEMFIDQRDSRYKWIPVARSESGLILWDDGGERVGHKGTTAYYRSLWLDQDQKEVVPGAVYCATQDKDHTIWVGTNEGIFTIPASVDFRISNTCERIKIARNDGTNLADYLLGTEQVNTIVVDGANRKWIGTEGSGLYLMSEDGTETIEHFTTDNSPILSNQVLSIAIDPVSGLVYVGTGAGLMSYQSDATAPQDNFSSAYAYPNPVRPGYEGVISIAGLMDETTVKITDSAGNVVFETISNGGLAIWNGRNGAGKCVANGIYTAFCNSGNNHEIVKILVMR